MIIPALGTNIETVSLSAKTAVIVSNYRVRLFKVKLLHCVVLGNYQTTTVMMTGLFTKPLIVYVYTLLYRSHKTSPYLH